MACSDLVYALDQKQSDPRTARRCPRGVDHGRMVAKKDGLVLMCQCGYEEDAGVSIGIN